MTRPTQDETAWLQSLGATERARFFALLSHNLTVALRVLCHGDGSAEQNLVRIRLLNEAHHRVSSYLLHFHVDDEDRSWIPAVVEYVLDPKEPAVLQQAQHAWFHARKALSRDESA